MIAVKDETGITLVELLVAVAISSLVASGLGAAVHQFVAVGERSRDTQRALHDIQNAGHWLSIDGNEAMSTDLVDNASPVGAMTLSWTVNSQAHSSTYYLSGNELRRDHNDSVTSVARNVTDVEFSRNGQLVTVSMISTPSGRWGVSKQATYNIWVRPVS